MSRVRFICLVNVAPVIVELNRLVWLPGGANPQAGEFAMLDSWPLEIPITPVIAKVLTHLPDRIQGKTLLSRLIPGQRIAPHTDGHDGGCRIRIHVPLVTNERAVFITGDKEHHLRVGFAYAIDPTQEHSAYNGGATDRIHMMFNAVRQGDE